MSERSARAQTSAGLLVEGALGLGLSLDPLQTERLLQFADLLIRWGAVFNLTAVRAPEAVVMRHLLDSLAVVSPMERWGNGRPLRVLDVGSGAGLPGVAIAVVRPSWQVTTVDAVAKKVAFVRQAVGELRLKNVVAQHGRVEAMPPTAAGFDLIVSRAFSSLAQFVRLTTGRLNPGGAWVAMKGRVSEAELKELPVEFEAFHVEHLAVPGTDAARSLVWIRPH